MNKLTIIGNLARDPELRTVRDGISVCDFTVAVNRRGSRQNTANGQSDADFFRVTAWRQLGELCEVSGKGTQGLRCRTCVRAYLYCQ